MRRLLPSHEGFIRDMLQRYADAGEWGIERRFVPEWILAELQKRGLITKIEATPRITEAGVRYLQSGGRS